MAWYLVKQRDNFALPKNPTRPACNQSLYWQNYEDVSKRFRTESITKYMLTTIKIVETTKRVMAAKLTTMSHKTATQPHLVTRELYHLQFSVRAAGPETFGYTLVCFRLICRTGSQMWPLFFTWTFWTLLMWVGILPPRPAPPHVLSTLHKLVLRCWWQVSLILHP